jgi:hypothetical protein
VRAGLRRERLRRDNRGWFLVILAAPAAAQGAASGPGGVVQ